MRGLSRVINVDSGATMKFSQAARKIADGLCAWTEYGVSIRTLTLAEQIQARNEIARNREPLAFAEIPGLKFVHPGVGAELHLAWEAGKFVAEAFAA